MSRIYLDGPAEYTDLDVSTSAVELKVGASVASYRQAVLIQPVDGEVYYGFDSSVTTSTGFKVFKNQTLFLGVGKDVDVYLIAASGTVDVRIAEIG